MIPSCFCSLRFPLQRMAEPRLDDFKSFRGQIVLYSASILFSDFGIDANGNQQRRQQLMAFIDFCRYGHARIRQMNVSALVHGNVAILCNEKSQRTNNKPATHHSMLDCMYYLAWQYNTVSQFFRFLTQSSLTKYSEQRILYPSGERCSLNCK